MDGVTSVESQSLYMLAFFLLFIFFLLALLVLFNWKREGIRGNVCPYCRKPMRLGIDVAFSMRSYVNAFLEEQPQLDNPQIDFSKAAYCSETGRIFTECVSTLERISLSWDFIQRKCSGKYISWGALSEDEKSIYKILHGSIEGFQTEESSHLLRPECVEPLFSTISPGPLYIDRETKILVGWKKVPGTYFEVLVVQHPQFQTLEETL